MPSSNRDNLAHDAQSMHGSLNIDQPYAAKKSVQISHVLLGLISLFIIIFLLLASPILPDYNTYMAMYFDGGGHLATFQRDIGYVYISSLLSQFISYESFRALISIIISFLIFIILRGFARQGASKRDVLLLFLALTPLILIKGGSQIREGLALFVWLSVIFNITSPPNPLKFIAIGVACYSIHISATPIWIATALSLYAFPKYPTPAYIAGIVIYAIAGYFIGDLSRFDNIFAYGLVEDVKNPDGLTLLYWVIFPLIGILFIALQRFILHPDGVSVNGLICILFVIRVSVIGLIIGLSIQLLSSGQYIFQNSILSDYLRIFSFYICLIPVIFAIKQRHYFCVILTLFLLVDTVRIILSVLAVS